MKRLLGVLFLIGLAVSSYAGESADAIAKKFYDLKDPDDVNSKALMTIIDSNKAQRTREFEMFSKRTNGINNMFIRFLAPADVRDTKFLTLGSASGKDEQRIYLPALKRTRRISSSDKTGKFVGSDLFYYDMESKKFEDYTYKLISDNAVMKEKQFEGMTFYVLESTPKDADAPYSRSIVYQNKADNFVYKTEAYDKNNNLWKTMFILSTKKIDGIIIPEDTLVVNHIDNSRTRLQVSDIKLNSGIRDAVFTIQNLEQ
jgi:outer membrane lipoprotein-sorting protein